MHKQYIYTLCVSLWMKSSAKSMNVIVVLARCSTMNLIACMTCDIFSILLLACSTVVIINPENRAGTETHCPLEHTPAAKQRQSITLHAFTSSQCAEHSRTVCYSCSRMSTDISDTI